MRQNDGLQGSDDAVSEIVGEVMLLAITVMIFTVLIAAIGTMMARPESEIVSMDAQKINGTAFAVQHKGGDSVRYVALNVSVNGVAAQIVPADVNANGLWDVGETVIVPGVNASQPLDAVVFDGLSKKALGRLILG